MSGHNVNSNYENKPTSVNGRDNFIKAVKDKVDKANAQKANSELSQGLSGGGIKDPDKGISVQRQEQNGNAHIADNTVDFETDYSKGYFNYNYDENTKDDKLNNYVEITPEMQAEIDEANAEIAKQQPKRVYTGHGITNIVKPDGTIVEIEIDESKYDGYPMLTDSRIKKTYVNVAEKSAWDKFVDSCRGAVEWVDQKVNQWTGGQIRRAGHGLAFFGGVGATALGGSAIGGLSTTAKLVGAGAVVAGTSSCTEKSEVDPPTIMKITEIVTNLNGENPKVNGEDAQYVAYGDKVKLQWGDGYSIDCDRETREALQNNPLNKLNTALQSIGVNTGVANPAIITEVNGGQNSWSGVPMLGMQNMTRDFNAQSLAQMQVTVDFPQISEDGLLEVDDKGNHVVTQKQATISDATGQYSLLNASGQVVGKNDTAFVIKAEDGEEYLVQTQNQNENEYGLNGNKVLVYYRKDGNDYKQAFMVAKGWTEGKFDIQQNDGFTNNVNIQAQGYDGLSDKLNACIMKLSFTHGIGVTVD